MSIRRAVEWHFKEVLTSALSADFPTYQVIESLRQEERPIPSVIIIAGEAQPMLPDQPNSERNYAVEVSVLVMSSVDKETVDNHSEVAYAINEAMRLRSNRKISRIAKLYLYEIEDGSVGEDNAGREMGTGTNYRVLCNYDPTLPDPSP